MIKEFFSRKKNIEERKEFFKKIKKYLIKTGDSTYTYNDPLFQETMHSLTGAYEESVHKFCIPSEIQKRKYLLDLFSGFGYNAAAALELNPGLKIDMIEKNPEILALGLLIPEVCEAHKIIKAAIESSLYNIGFIKNRVYETPKNIRLFIEDALNFRYENNYDVIFHDAYSPKRNWKPYSLIFFKKLYKVLDENGVLLTYSSSSPMRSSLLEADFYIGGTEAYKRKRSGTIASKRDLKLKNLSREEERVISLTDLGIPYVKNRDDLREKLRNKVLFSSSVKMCFENIYNFGEKFQITDREKNKAERSIKKMELAKKEIIYVVCPQYEKCICGKCSRRYENTTERIKEMRYRLLKLKGINVKDFITHFFERFKTNKSIVSI